MLWECIWRKNTINKTLKWIPYSGEENVFQKLDDFVKANYYSSEGLLVCSICEYSNKTSTNVRTHIDNRNSSRAWNSKESAVSVLWLCLSQQKRPENACEETSIIKFSTCFRYWKCDKIWPLLGCGRDTFMINVVSNIFHCTNFEMHHSSIVNSKLI